MLKERENDCRENMKLKVPASHFSNNHTRKEHEGRTGLEFINHTRKRKEHEGRTGLEFINHTHEEGA